MAEEPKNTVSITAADGDERANIDMTKIIDLLPDNANNEMIAAMLTSVTMAYGVNRSAAREVITIYVKMMAAIAQQGVLDEGENDDSCECDGCKARRAARTVH